MKINPLKKKLNSNPEEVIEVTKEELFKYFYKLMTINNLSLNDSEIKVLSNLSADKDLLESGITKNNLPPIIKKLNEKGLMEGKGLSPIGMMYKDRLTSELQIIINLRIKDDFG